MILQKRPPKFIRESLLCAVVGFMELVVIKHTQHNLEFSKLNPLKFYLYAEQKKIMSNSLFFVGEVGGNDYNHLIVREKSLDELHEVVPNVVGAISSAITVCMCVPLSSEVMFGACMHLH